MGKAIFFVKGSFKALETIEAGQINVNYLIFCQNIIFWKILIPQHYTCWILSDFYLNLFYFIMQIDPVTRE